MQTIYTEQAPKVVKTFGACSVYGHPVNFTIVKSYTRAVSRLRLCLFVILSAFSVYPKPQTPYHPSPSNEKHSVDPYGHTGVI